ncbi:hypothetical protein BZG36_01830 [Bifiguratus adelaidae]|uniref:Cysteine proteinase 1, mitochondrial n=1 Tax=Bifiguratus adelaidae TaxID=1938954 RepID=A0A261Y2F8_9FUNG|nr:hypothetical protein BZG36_01830 [Bifiguratus adelaidae]
MATTVEDNNADPEKVEEHMYEAIDESHLTEKDRELKAIERRLNAKLDQELLAKGDDMLWPKAVRFIIPNELGERFCYYGVRPLFNVYLQTFMGMNPIDAKIQVSNFTFMSYFFPLIGAALSDSFFGKYVTIVGLSVVYAIGLVLLAVFSIPGIAGAYEAKPLFTYLLPAVLIAFGTGGIKPCGLNFFFSIFYVSINVGSLISGFLMPPLKDSIMCYGHNCYCLVYGICASVFVVDAIIFAIGHHWYCIVPPGGEFLPWKAVKGTFYALYKNYKATPEERGTMGCWLNFAAPLVGEKFVPEIRYLGRIIPQLIPVIGFWLVYDQGQTEWQNQYLMMNPRVSGTFSIPVESFGNVNTIFIIIFVPFLQFIYRMLERNNIRFTILQRMGTGFFLMVVAFALSGIIQGEAIKYYNFEEDPECYNCMRGLWQLPQWALLSFAEALISPEGLKFTYTDVGKQMRSQSASFWLLTTSFGNLLISVMEQGLASNRRLQTDTIPSDLGIVSYPIKYYKYTCICFGFNLLFIAWAYFKWQYVTPEACMTTVPGRSERKKLRELAERARHEDEATLSERLDQDEKTECQPSVVKRETSDTFSSTMQEKQPARHQDLNSLSERLSDLALLDKETSDILGPLTGEFLQSFKGDFSQDSKNLLALNAITRTDLSQVLVNRKAAVADHHDFSLKLDLEGLATNQKQSGRCWLFAGTNVLRLAVMKKYNLEDFELSQPYLFFYDKLEKANYFLESMITLADRDVDDRVVQYLLQAPVNDGGQWDQFVNVVEKYGVVPKVAYPETYSSSASGKLNWIVTAKLREYAVEIRQNYREAIHQKGMPSTKARSLLRASKSHYMNEIYRILTITLGEPPEKFTWSFRNKDGKFYQFTDLTPKTFIKEHCGYPIGETMSLINDPRNNYMKLYTVEFLGNVVGGHPIRYVNVPINQMKKLALAALKSGKPVWFGADVGKFSDRDLAVMDTQIYDYELAFNIKLGLTKEQRLLYGESLMTHAMVFTGAHIDPQDPNKAIRWRVQNSWGNEHGDKGYWILTDEWFDQFVYQIVLEKTEVPKDIVQVLKTEPVVLPAYDPMGALAGHHYSTLPHYLPYVLTSLAAIGIAVFFWGKKKEPVLDPKTYKRFKLIGKTVVSPNTAIYRFGLPYKDAVLGLPIGQHISVMAELNGKEVSRSYTPITSDDDIGYFELMIKTYPSGNISKYFSTLSINDSVNIRGPKGQFVYTPNMVREFGMIAGGTGITPMLQIIKAILKNPRDQTKVSLIFANVNEEDILLREELDALAKEYPDKFKVYYVLNNPPEAWTGSVGFVTTDIIKKHCPAPANDIKILLCGPPPMISAMTKATTELGYAKPRAVSKLEDQITGIESALRSLTYILPGRFEDAEFASQALYAGLNILGLYNDTILQRAARDFSAENNVPTPKPSLFNRYTRYWFQQGQNPRHPNAYKQVALMLTVIGYTQVLVEMGVRKKMGNRARWKFIVLIEIVKAGCRLYLLNLTNHRTFLHNTHLERDIDPSTLSQQAEETETDKAAQPKEWVGPRTGASHPTLDAALPHRNGTANGHTNGFANGSHPFNPLNGFSNGNKGGDDVKKYLMSKVLTPEQLKKPYDLVHRLRGFGVIGEYLFILRPVLYVLAIQKYGRHSWNPWLLSLAVEMASRELIKQYFASGGKDGSRIAMTELESGEQSYRKWLFIYYLLRAPFYERYTRPRLERFCDKVQNKPLISIVAGVIRDYQPLWESVYFYTSAS